MERYFLRGKKVSKVPRSKKQVEANDSPQIQSIEQVGISGRGGGFLLEGKGVPRLARHR